MAALSESLIPSAPTGSHVSATGQGAPNPATAASAPAPASPESDGISDLPISKVPWTQDQEVQVCNWGDQAGAYLWMHDVAQARFMFLNNLIIATVFILSGVSGLANTIVSASGVDFKGIWIFGVISIAHASFTGLTDRIGLQQRVTEHSQYATQWRNLRYQIVDEISQPTDQRVDPVSFMRLIRKQMEKISSESDALIPGSIRRECADKFKNTPNYKLPEICGELEHTTVNIASASAPVPPSTPQHPD